MKSVPFCLLACLSSPCQAFTSIYDIDFSSPTHTLGSPAATGSGPDVFSSSSSFFGGPEVVAAALGTTLGDQPAVFSMAGNQPSFYYDQARLELPPLTERYLYLNFDFAADQFFGSGAGMTVFFDTPQVRRIDFEDNGTIDVWVPGGTPAVLGSFTEGGSNRAEIEIDLHLNLLTVTINGVAATPVDFAPESAFETIRFSYGLNSSVLSPDDDSSFALDNIEVFTAGERPEPVAHPTWWPTTGWVYMQWPYLYDPSDESWRYFSGASSNRNWHLNVRTNSWSKLDTTEGWLYIHSSPGYFFESAHSDWHFYSTGNEQWINDLSTNVWSVFAPMMLP